MIESKTIRSLKTAWIRCEPEKGAGEERHRPILLFLHGCPDDPTMWQKQLDHFSERYTVVAPYARGIGGSEPSRDPARYSLDAMALDHLEILRAVDPTGKRPLFVIGHDLGGPQAWRLAQLLGDRLGGLVAINGPSLRQMSRQLRNPRQLAKSWYIGVFQLRGVAEVLLKLKERDFVRKAYRAGGFSREAASAMAGKGRIVPFLPQYRRLMNELPAQLIGRERVERPALVIWGKDDAFLEVPKPESIRREAPEFTLRVLDGNHWVFHDKAEQVNRLIDDFVVQCVGLHVGPVPTQGAS